VRFEFKTENCITCILSDISLCIHTKSLPKPPKCRLISSYELNAHFLYSIIIYMLHYNPQHVSSSTLLIFRRTNCIITASVIVTLHTVCRLRADCSPLSTGMLYGCLQTVTIPEAVIIQFVFLKMSKVLLETC